MTAKLLERMRLQSMEELGLGPTAMKKIKKCPECGVASPAENGYCRECGSRLPETTVFDFYKSLHRVCTDCGTVVKENLLFCPQCGKRLQDIQSRQPGGVV